MKCNPEIYKLGEKTQFSSENQPKNNQGRPKNKFAHLRDKYELSNNDVANILRYLLIQEKEDLESMKQKSETPVIILAFITAILDAIKRGNLNQINSMLDRLIGKPKESIDINTPENIKIIIEKLENERKEDKIPT